MTRARQPVSVDGIEFDALIDQSVSYEAQVPEYPTEKGFNVSDNISLSSESISMTLFVSDTPVTWRQRFGPGQGRVDRVVRQLQELYFAKKVITVTTSDEVYSDVVITSMSISKSADTGYAREIPIALQKIVVTESKTVTIPASYGKSGKTGASAGTANTSNASSEGSRSGSSEPKAENSSSSNSGGSDDSGKGGSILYNAAKGFGLL